MTTLTTRVHVKADRETTFDHLIAFETYPEFIKHLHAVERDPERQQRVDFTLTVAGSERVHRVDVEYDRPNGRVYWNGRDGREHSGVAEITELNARRSALTVNVDVVLTGTLDRASAQTGVLRNQIERQLHQFAAYVEEQAGVRPARGQEGHRSPSEKLFDTVFPTDETTRGR